MIVDDKLTPAGLKDALARFFELAGGKIRKLNADWDPAKGSPVFTRKGAYTSQGWTEWTQGFQFGCQILQFEATGDESFLRLGRENTIRHMAPHVSHIGVHDHGFNNVSTYGNLRRLALEGKTTESPDAMHFHELALKISGAVQASRWTDIPGGGYIHSFNGAHSLFSDTVRSVRALIVAHKLGHALMAEGDKRHSLLERAVQHLRATAKYNVYYGEGRDIYDVRGRVVHESIFNVKDGAYRCPSTQQGYSAFSTWTRGLAWIMAGYAEELEAFAQMPASDLEPYGGWDALREEMLKPALASCDFYLENTATDGIPYWDTGAPGLVHLGAIYEKASEPDNPHEPVDSSAAAIAAQGLLRLGRFLGTETKEGQKYWQAGLSVARTLFAPPYLSTDESHHGLVLHSVYHRPNGWDECPDGDGVPRGESSMWGDYHAMELAIYLDRINKGEEPFTFYH